MKSFYTTYKSPIGTILIIGNKKGISELEFTKDTPKDTEHSPLFFEDITNQLDRYFKGELKEFNIKLNPQGTEFQQNVWKELLKIPYGKTATYKEIAGKIGNKKASRAIGMANNRNKIAILIPCHRVIGTNNKLVGYAGGIEKKKYLLKLESSS